MSDLPLIPKLGVGLLYQTELRPFIESERARFDFLEVIPDILWTDLGVHHRPRYIEDSREVNFLRQLSAEVPMVVHSIGLSIGSACRFDRAHIAQIAEWYAWLKFPWHSDHLAFIIAGHGKKEINVGVTLPLPCDQESLKLLVPRVTEVCSRVPVPFLLENNVYFFEYPQQDFDEATFLNQLCEISGCRLLLDLHNLYTNSRNHAIDPYVWLAKLNLENVVEIHVAGGMEDNGFYQDAHSDICPSAVWKLLEWVLPQCPNLGGVVFELLGSWYTDVGEDGVSAQLSQMRELWMRHQPTPQPEMVL
ncbi:MAG TPA: DUF692 family multinuclear iron-containing protein [Pyrinomonadaceae bacterium]|jgi:uncharacterized protein (UPF0276 family)